MWGWVMPESCLNSRGHCLFFFIFPPSLPGLKLLVWVTQLFEVFISIVMFEVEVALERKREITLSLSAGGRRL